MFIVCCRVSARIQWSLGEPVQAVELRQACPVAVVAVAERAGLRDKRLHAPVERRKAHASTGQVSEAREYPPRPRRCIRLSRHAAALHRGLLPRPKLLDQFLLVGRSRFSGCHRSHRREKFHEETRQSSEHIFETKNTGEGEIEQKLLSRK